MSTEQARRLLQERARQSKAVRQGIPKAGEEAAVLSATQQRLWMFQQLNPDSVATVRLTGLRFAGPLHKEALVWSLNEVVKRHEILRTVYQERDGTVYQVALPALPLAVEIVGLGHLNGVEQQHAVRRIAKEESNKIIDLTARPFGAAVLLELAEQHHLLLLAIHHIAFDGWSETILIRELAALYRGYQTGNLAPLPPMALQYRDFAVWQQARFAAGHDETHIAYWREHLAGMEPTLPLPADFPMVGPAVRERKQHTFTLPGNLIERVEAFSRENNATLFMTLLALFKTLLYRYSLHEDITVGTLTAGRTHPDTEPLIGGFANLAVLRTRFSGEATFREFLAQVRQTALGAFAHQELPFERLIAALEPQRRLAESPFFQVLFELRNLPWRSIRLDDGLTITRERLSQNLGTWALIVEFESGAHGMGCVIEYATDLFKHETVKGLAGHFQTLVEAALTAPDLPISSLPLITAQERQALIELGQGERGWYAAEPCLHQWFEQQAARTPYRPAANIGTDRLSYDELNRKANRLAHLLVQQGVHPETPVALCLERSLDLLVAILGALKAGGAYVPLDPSHPPERLAFMLHDSGAVLLVAHGATRSRLPDTPVPVLDLDASEGEIDACPDHNPSAAVGPRHLAYIIYTSGSTGKPKGVLVEHGHIVRLFRATEQWFHLGEQDVWTLFHSYAFDFSVWEMWGALLYGGRLVIVPREVSRNAEEFYRLLSDERVTVLSQTPSAFAVLMQVDETAGLQGVPDLRLVVFGGESLDIQRLRPWLERHGDEKPRLVNMYGITETTVHVTYRPVHLSDLETGKGSMIGQPIPDLSLHVLDERFEPVPAGVPGGIYVGGAGVARGYLNRPELTRERFIPDPFAGSPQARLYHSGDLAKRTPDGDIEYLGRRDQQVKIRGYRIETGEIEAVLKQHVAIRDAVVLLSKEERGNRTLTAYLVLAPGIAVTVPELRRHSASWLPPYMIPTEFVILDSLPLTPNGKLDRSALPEPSHAAAPASQHRTMPRTPAEETLAGIWRQLLDINDIDVHESFFDLGGHSLLLMKLASHINDSFGVRVPLRILFDANTIDTMTLAILERQVLESDQEIVAQMIARLNQLSPDEILRLLENE